MKSKNLINIKMINIFPVNRVPVVEKQIQVISKSNQSYKSIFGLDQ